MLVRIKNACDCISLLFHSFCSTSFCPDNLQFYIFREGRANFWILGCILFSNLLVGFVHGLFTFDERKPAKALTELQQSLLLLPED